MIRAARPEDVGQILAFWNPMIRDTLVTFQPHGKTEAEVLEAIRSKPASGHAFLVAEEDGEVLGFASYGQFRAGPGYAKAMEHTIILAEEAHGKGIGRALMRAIEDHARQQGYRTMVAAVTGENLAGQAFHAAIGYERVGLLPQSGYKFGRYIDLVLMQKILS